MGLPLLVAGAFISSAAVYGMIAPPVNVLVMTIGGGIDLPYIGFDLPLALFSFPLAILTSIYLGYRYVEKDKLARVIERSRAQGGEGGFLLYAAAGGVHADGRPGRHFRSGSLTPVCR